MVYYIKSKLNEQHFAVVTWQNMKKKKKVPGVGHTRHDTVIIFLCLIASCNKTKQRNQRHLPSNRFTSRLLFLKHTPRVCMAASTFPSRPPSTSIRHLPPFPLLSSAQKRGTMVSTDCRICGCTTSPLQWGAERREDGAHMLRSPNPPCLFVCPFFRACIRTEEEVWRRSKLAYVFFLYLHAGLYIDILQTSSNTPTFSPLYSCLPLFQADRILHLSTKWYMHKKDNSHSHSTISPSSSSFYFVFNLPDRDGGGNERGKDNMALVV